MNRKINLIFAFLLTAMSLIFGCSACNQNEQLNENTKPSNDYFEQLNENSKLSNDYIAGEFYTLQEAYESNLLTVNDLMYISYYYSGKVMKVEQGVDYHDLKNWQEIDFKPTVALPVLDSETEEHIKISFYNKNIRLFKDGEGNIKKYEKDLVKVTAFLGNYNGNYVVQIDSDEIIYGTGSPVVCMGGIILDEGAPPIMVFSIKAQENIFYNQYGTKFTYEKFYGVYEDAQIFFVAGDATAIRYVSIAGNIFKYNTLWEIYVFKSSKFYTLKDAYLLGVLSNQAVDELSKVHADYVKSQRNESDDDFNAWYYNTEDIREIIN